MNKIFLIIACFLMFVSAANADLMQDKSGEFSFTCPEGWKKIDAPIHSLLMYSSKDGNHIIMFSDEFEKDPITKFKTQLEGNSQKKPSSKKSKIISDNIIKLKNGKQAIKTIYEVEHPSRSDVTLRSINYVIALESGKWISVICTVFKKDGVSYDSVYGDIDNLVNSIN